MSVWNTLSAGLQKVQKSLDQVLDGEQTDGQQVEEGDDATSTHTKEPQQSTLHQQPSDSQATPPITTPPGGGEEGLREALIASEQQLQLINTEYRRLLKEKESEIQSLKNGLSTKPSTVSGDEITSALEMVQKELAAHKEMVAELRGQLTEKEFEFQELNSKAENKFNKLKSQAKNKIASLTKEVESLRVTRGEESMVNVSTLSLDDSIASSVGGASSLPHPQLESLRSEVESKAQLISDLRDKLTLAKEEKNKMAVQFASLSDKLNVSEVCLQQERGSVVTLQLQTTRLEEEVGVVKQELVVATSNQDMALEELENERKAKQALQDQVTDLIDQLEKSNDTVATSTQITNESPVSMASSPTPVLAAGSRGSLLDLEGEVGRLETTLQGREEQLTSFKTILDEKEKIICKEKLTNSNLTAQLDEKTHKLEELQQLCISSQNQIEQNMDKLSEKEAETQGLQQSFAEVQAAYQSLQDKAKSENDKIGNCLEQIQDLEQQVTEMESALVKKDTALVELESFNEKLTKSLAITKESLVARQQEQELLAEQLLEKDDLVQKLKETLNERENVMATSDGKFESTLKELDEQNTKIAQIEEKFEELLVEKETLLKQNVELENKCSHLTGGLEFAQQELTTKDNTIKGLTQTLEEKKTLALSLESQIASIKSEHAEKLTEIVQHKEQALQSRSDLNSQLSQLQRTLDSREKQLASEQEAMKKLQVNYESAQEELVELQSKVFILKRESEEKQLESETLRGQVDNLSHLESSFSSEHTCFETELTDLKSQLSQKNSQIADMQQKLRSAKQMLQKAVKSKEEFAERKENFQSELEKHKKENEQMKEQFDSAMKMMETKLANQATALSQVTMELSEKDTHLLVLKEELETKQRNSLALEEKVSQISNDYKMATERTQIFEQEKDKLTHKISELSSQCEHFSELLAETQASNSSLQLEHEALLRQSQEGEGQVVVLTQQLGQLAREKQECDDKVRELSRQLVGSEQRQLALNVQLEELQQQSTVIQSWEIEKQALHDANEVLEGERNALQSKEAQLQTQVGQLQEELSSTLTQLESVRQGRDVGSTLLNEELQKRLTTQTETHLSETTQLQQALDSERERRKEAEKKLGELQGEVAIPMDDQVLSDQQLAPPQNFMDYVAIAKSWSQRFIKNPNVVLMRLYRAAPRTKLFFLGYFVLLHLLLLYFLFV